MRELPDDEVHVFYAAPGEPFQSERWLLSPDELARLERYRFERDRDVFLATRVLVRTVLSLYEPVAPEAWRFTVNAHGRPEVAGSLRFNLSNTHGLVVCAVARGREVGVDVERFDRRTRLAVADRHFAPAEVAALAALPEAERSRRFFDYWTLKESYIKARGLGLSLPLAKFAFTLEDGQPPRIAIDPALGDDAAWWWFAQARPTADHLVALCARRSRPGAEIAVRWQWLGSSSEGFPPSA